MRACTHPTFVQYVFEQQGLRLIALDAVASGQPHGELCPQCLAWLAQTLAVSHAVVVGDFGGPRDFDS